MPLDELPVGERTCKNCENRGTDGLCCVMCSRNMIEPNRVLRESGHDYWVETSGLLRARIEKRISELEASVRFYCARCDMLIREQSRMRDPERQIVCDILANGALLPDPQGTRYGRKEGK